jgi:hypothetical protein
MKYYSFEMFCCPISNSWIFRIALLLQITQLTINAQAQITHDHIQDEWISSRFVRSSKIFDSDYTRFNNIHLRDNDFITEGSLIQSGSPYWRLHSGFKIEFDQNLNFQYSFGISNTPVAFAGYSGNTYYAFGDLRAFNDNTMLTYQSDNIQVSFGRGLIETSSYGENLLLNRSNYVNDFIYLKLDRSNLQVENIILLLKQYDQYRRYLIYHRYGYTFNKIRVGFSDVALIAFEEFNNYTYKYFMPYSFFYDVEANGSGFANLIWRFDASILFDKSLVWAELLVDDFAIDFLSPPKLGYLVGFKSEWNNHPYILKYVKVNRWVYNYGSDQPQLKFIDYNLPLGNPIGPDALKLALSSELKWGGGFDCNFYPELFYRIDGEGSIEEEPPAPSGKNFGYFYQPFLTGELMHSSGINLLSVLKFNSLSFKLYVSYSSNEENSISFMANYMFKH